MLLKKVALANRILRLADPGKPVPDNMMESLNSKPEGPHKFATILADKTRQLLALDRYERRAPYRDVNLPFEPSMRRGSRNLIVTPDE
jgi:hypothetical protein